MVFVYTGKGRRQAQKDDALPEQKKCAKQACAIQWCLAKRDHKEHLCQNYIDEWKDCCEKARAAAVVAMDAEPSVAAAGAGAASSSSEDNDMMEKKDK
ncbi:hypothetical protein ACHAWC_011674 [Mediolabrus comicus]